MTTRQRPMSPAEKRAERRTVKREQHKFRERGKLESAKANVVRRDEMVLIARGASRTGAHRTPGRRKPAGEEGCAAPRGTGWPGSRQAVTRVSMRHCPICGGEPTPLGRLGILTWLRCIQCGWEWSVEGDSRHWEWGVLVDGPEQYDLEADPFEEE